ncbi:MULTISPECIES: carboxylesterase/lipase family protein [unclassified Micromonospora]|uniref:carboxylesterase/lipase family protein n=1 Tax=unclassified Micromonospora TaxID=2617518 RepID=UPI0033A7A2E6
MDDSTSVVETTKGAVRGRSTGGVSAFLGIPYAAPPLGPNRLRAPQPVQPWTGVRDATAYGPTVPKSDYPAPVVPLLPEVTIPGEDCLNLNVWTPGTSPSDRPVFVWIHGGSFTSGSGANAEYDGTAFARDGVVCVTINYRLGADGFLELPDADTNRGLRDMIAALEWVRDNIAAFGGDPRQVTLAGESAGAMAVAPLMAVPAARGLFARAVLQSGAASNVLTVDQAALVAERLTAGLRIPATREAVAGVPIDQLIGAVTQLGLHVRAPGTAAGWGDIARLLPFAPVVDGDLLPHPPMEVATTQVPALIGTNRDEGRLFFVPGRAIDVIDEAMLAGFAANNGITDLAPFVGTTPGETLVNAYTHARFVRPATQLVRARGAVPTWSYRFDGLDLEDNDGLGSCHTAEVPFVFATTGLPQMRPRIGAHPSAAVADTMHSTWVRFATTGDPGWAPGTTAHLASHPTGSVV